MADLTFERRTLLVQLFGVSMRSHLDRSLDRTKRRTDWRPWHEGRVPRYDNEILAEWAFRQARRQGHHPLVDNALNWRYDPGETGPLAWQSMVVSVILCETDEDREAVRRMRRWDKRTLVYAAPTGPASLASYQVETTP